MERRFEKLGNRMAIIKLRESGKKYREIREIIGYSVPTICKWIKRNSVEDKKRRRSTTKNYSKSCGHDRQKSKKCLD